METERRIQRAMTWCGLPLMVLTAVGFAVSGLLPVPLGADWGAARMVGFYGANPIAVRTGFLLSAIGLTLIGPLTAVITAQLRRIDGVPAALAHLQQLGGTCVVIVTVLPMIIMNVAAFRPDRDPQVTVAITDLAWLLLITPIGLFFLQEVPIAVAILLDRSKRPVFPRWVGYANLWIPLTFVPAFFPYFTKSGPFAWQGVLVFYLGLITFGAWVFIMMWALLKALRDPATEALDTVPAHS